MVFTFGPSGQEGEFETLSGIAEVLADDVETIAGNAQITLSNMSEEENTAKGKFSFTDDEFKEFGIGAATGTFEAVVEEGKIKSITATIDEETLQKLEQLFGGSPGPPPSAAVSVIAKFDPSANEMPEALTVDQQGNIYVGMAFTGEIRRLTPQGEATTFANLPSPGENGFMTGLAFDRSGDLYVAMASFDPETHGIWRVSQDGSVVKRFASLDTTGLPNGVDFDSGGNLYVANSTGGQVWKIDQQGNVAFWSADPLLQGIIPSVSPLGFPIGANGVALDAEENNLYVANFEFGRIVRIPVNPDGSAGNAQVFVEDKATLEGADGITFDNEGNLFVAVIAQDRLVAISPQGDIFTVAEGAPLQNPSDIKFGVGEEEKVAYITNFAFFRVLGLAPGDPEPALLKIIHKAP